ncbi:hypothetical protein [Corynebacterium sp. H130]|uniref:hypothetical protein n=1 Tax=Corynebacterium sp. H130 TaxID=3133444 RepID=UPI0030A4600D
MFENRLATVRFVGALGLVIAGIAGTVTLKHETTVVSPELQQVAAEAAPASDYIDRASLDNFIDNPAGTQLTFVRLSDGEHLGSSTERFPRPALSLIKLYVADYVLLKGTEDEKQLALEMIKSSDDEVAAELVEEYPDAIEATARTYSLWSTEAGESWGTSRTSTYDAVKFLRAKIESDPNSPLLEAMRESHEVANDGYEQDFGTATLPGVKGTKWGWSNDRMLHSSISFGDDFVVAAAVLGSAEDLTDLVERQVAPHLAR